MKRAIAIIVLIAAGCQSQTPGAAYVAADISRFEAFAPVVQRDVASGHADTQRLYDSWGILVNAERATIAPSK